MALDSMTSKVSFVTPTRLPRGVFIHQFRQFVSVQPSEAEPSWLAAAG
jgi:hypothetical protein